MGRDNPGLVRRRRRRGLSPKWTEKVAASLERLRAYAQVDTVGELERSTFEDFFAALQDGEITGKAIGHKTANNYLSGYSAFFKWCCDHEHVPAGWAIPSAASEWTKGEHNQRRALRLDEALGIFHQAVLDETRENHTTRTMDGKRVYRSGFYWTMFCTGVRAGAAEQLRRRHFELDTDTPTIHVPAFNGGKGAKALAIPISKNDADVLLDYFNRLPEELDPHDLALTRPHHRVLQRDAENAGIQMRDEFDRPIGFHSFRRFHTTELFRMGADPKVVQQRMGHASLITTLKHYNDVLREDEKKVATAFGNRVLKKNAADPLDRPGRMTDTGSGEQSDSQQLIRTEPSELDPPPIVHQQKGGRSSIGTLPRQEPDGKRTAIGVRGFEPPATSTPLNRGEALDLLRRWTAILERLT